MANNDITDFLLKEYENVAQAFFNSYEIAAKWVRYYLIIAAVPFSFIALTQRDNTNQFNLFDLNNTIAFLFCAIGLLNILVSYIIIDLKLDSKLYARTVNGIRKYFVEQNPGLKINLNEYIVLPTVTNKPIFSIYNGDLFVLIVLMAAINSFYAIFGLVQIKQIKDFYLPCIQQKWLFLIFSAISIVFHFCLFASASRDKEKNYCKKENENFPN